MEKIAWELLKQFPTEYKATLILYIAIIVITIFLTIQTLRIKDLIKFVETLKTEPHKCVHIDIVDRVKESEYQLEMMRKEVNAISGENMLIKSELEAIKQNTANIMTQILDLNKNVVLVATSVNKNK